MRLYVGSSTQFVQDTRLSRIAGKFIDAFVRQEWAGGKSQSHDSVVKRSKDQFVDLVKNTCRVLRARGMKGCYVHLMDKDTKRFVRSRIQ